MIEQATRVPELNFALPETTLDQARSITRNYFNVKGEVHLLPGERERNFRLDAAEHCYIMKIAPAETGKPSLEMQAAALDHLAAIAPDLPVPRVIHTVR